MNIAMPMMSRMPTPPVKTIFRKNSSERAYYQPVPRGLEIKIAEKLAHLKELDKKT